MSVPLKTDYVIELARLIEDHKGEKTIVLDVHEKCSWTDFFIISTAKSHAHLKGILRHLTDFMEKNGTHLPGKHKHISEDGWVLLDCGSLVIHLMNQEMRDFYELEKLWFSAPVCYQSSKSS